MLGVVSPWDNEWWVWGIWYTLHYYKNLDEFEAGKIWPMCPCHTMRRIELLHRGNPHEPAERMQTYQPFLLGWKAVIDTKWKCTMQKSEAWKGHIRSSRPTSTSSAYVYHVYIIRMYVLIVCKCGCVRFFDTAGRVNEIADTHNTEICAEIYNRGLKAAMCIKPSYKEKRCPTAKPIDGYHVSFCFVASVIKVILSGIQVTQLYFVYLSIPFNSSPFFCFEGDWVADVSRMAAVFVV